MTERALVRRKIDIVRRGDDPALYVRRQGFINRLTPHIGPILTEGGFFSGALGGLTDAQRLVFFEVALHRASIREFGRQPSEQPRRVKRPPVPGQSGKQLIDPLEERYITRFTQAGIAWDEYSGMLTTANENIRIASRQDFTI